MTPEKQASVLVVEDERIVAKDIQQSLRGLGYDAFAIAASAEEALACIDTRRPDLVLMDIRIRGARDGVEVAREVRDRFAVPVVFLTAHADEGTLDRARRTEPYGYLLKPLKPAELRIAVEIALYKRQMEERLRRQERWHTTTLECIADAVLCADCAGSGRVTFANRAAEKLLGVGRVELVGFPLTDALHLSQEGAAGPFRPSGVERVRRLAPADNLHLRRPDGGIREVRVTSADVADAEQSLGVVLVVYDVTEERKVQRELERADRMRAVTTMIAGLATEVKNPLAVLVANASFARAEIDAHRADLAAAGVGLDEARTRRLDDVVRLLADGRGAVARIESLFDELQAFVAPGADAAEADVATAVRWTLEAIKSQLEPRARVEVDLVEGCQVAIEPRRLAQLFLNLVLNALQAIAPDEPDQNVIAVRASLDDGRVIVSISDTGAGIPEGLESRIFEPFFSTREVGQGTGLGLSIAHHIAASAGGTIEIAGRRGPGRGTTMRVVLPLLRGAGNGGR